eukprot:TRINITY_DN4224_c0_g1_i2.p1 TRINITY_DN4224_c0_g1~~TRINITY_DN4224_c0_g1_i2.p1  ORF type:complete len:356 (-),score=72.24 TRINITY_DN4224_c0_g1_i2:151-1218(-)
METAKYLSLGSNRCCGVDLDGDAKSVISWPILPCALLVSVAIIAMGLYFKAWIVVARCHDGGSAIENIQLFVIAIQVPLSLLLFYFTISNAGQNFRLQGLSVMVGAAFLLLLAVYITSDVVISEHPGFYQNQSQMEVAVQDSGFSVHTVRFSIVAMDLLSLLGPIVFCLFATSYFCDVRELHHYLESNSLILDSSGNTGTVLAKAIEYGKICSQLSWAARTTVGLSISGMALQLASTTMLSLLEVPFQELSIFVNGVTAWWLISNFGGALLSLLCIILPAALSYSTAHHVHVEMLRYLTKSKLTDEDVENIEHANSIHLAVQIMGGHVSTKQLTFLLLFVFGLVSVALHLGVSVQ